MSYEKLETPFEKFSVEDFPEHGISLIVPSDSRFGDLQSRLTKVNRSSMGNRYLVFLTNSGDRAVVGYSIKWECLDSSGNSSDRNVHNNRNLSYLCSWVLLHGEEADRRAVINRSQEVIKPDSIWFITDDSEGPLDGSSGEGFLSPMTFYELDGAETLQGCATMRVVIDGIFFDDGIFIGSDSNGFFNRVKTEMDTRYEILLGVQTDLRSGKSTDEIFRGLERLRNQEGLYPGPSSVELRAFFRKLFAQDVLGKKEMWGVDKAIADVHLQLSNPWVSLRKL